MLEVLVLSLLLFIAKISAGLDESKEYLEKLEYEYFKENCITMHSYSDFLNKFSEVLVVHNAIFMEPIKLSSICAEQNDLLRYIVYPLTHSFKNNITDEDIYEKEQAIKNALVISDFFKITLYNNYSTIYTYIPSSCRQLLYIISSVQVKINLVCVHLYNREVKRFGCRLNAQKHFSNSLACMNLSLDTLEEIGLNKKIVSAIKTNEKFNSKIDGIIENYKKHNIYNYHDIMQMEKKFNPKIKSIIETHKNYKKWTSFPIFINCAYEINRVVFPLYMDNKKGLIIISWFNTMFYRMYLLKNLELSIEKNIYGYSILKNLYIILKTLQTMLRMNNNCCFL